jgi:hypothetical protein
MPSTTKCTPIAGSKRGWDDAAAVARIPGGHHLGRTAKSQIRLKFDHTGGRRSYR